MINKTKLLVFTIVVLIVMNLTLLVFLGLNSHPNEDGKGMQPREIIINKLRLDSKQQKQYQELIYLHHKEINKLDQEIRNSKQELYLLLTKSKFDIKVKDSLTTVLANYQKQIETTHFNHFQDIKKICHKSQLQDFDELTFDLSHIFQNSKPPK